MAETMQNPLEAPRAAQQPSAPGGRQEPILAQPMQSPPEAPRVGQQPAVSGIPLPPSPVAAVNAANFTPVMQQIHAASEESLRASGEDAQTRGRRAIEMAQRIWAWIARMTRKLFSRAGYSPDEVPTHLTDEQAQGKAPTTANLVPKHGQAAAARAGEGAGERPPEPVPPEMAAQAAEQTAAALADYVIKHGPRMDLLADPATAHEYLESASRQLAEIVESYRMQEMDSRQKAETMLQELALAQGTSARVIQRMLESGADAGLLDKTGAYRKARSDEIQHRSATATARNALAALIAAAADVPELAEVANRCGLRHLPNWQEVLAERQITERTHTPPVPAVPLTSANNQIISQKVDNAKLGWLQNATSTIETPAASGRSADFPTDAQARPPSAGSSFAALAARSAEFDDEDDEVRHERDLRG